MPAGPVAVRWLGHQIPQPRAGRMELARIELENAGSASWLERPGAALFLSYHWLDTGGNPIVWEGLRAALPRRVAPAERLLVDLPVRGPIPPGRYRLALDVVDEGRFWFAELGNRRLELDLDVAPRLATRSLAAQIGRGPSALVDETRAALARQEEPVTEIGEATASLAPGCLPAPDWSSRVLDAHEEGYAMVAGSIAVEGTRRERRALRGELDSWAPGFGRAPTWELPLLCPSVVQEVLHVAPWRDPVAGMPALDPATSELDEPWLCDGRIRIAVSARALR